MPSPDRLDGQVALVTGGGRGIGRRIALELADAGARVAVEADVSDRAAVEAMVAQVERELGPIDLLVANAGVAIWEHAAWELEPDEWWHVLEVNVLGVYLCCRAVLPGMIERGRGRIVITGSGAAYLPGSQSTAYSASKAAVWRLGETLALQTEPHGIPIFVISPGLVRTDMTEPVFGDDAPWTPPELAPRLVRVLASGRADALSGRYIHAEHDDVEELIRRAEEIREQDLNVIRLRR